MGWEGREGREVGLGEGKGTKWAPGGRQSDTTFTDPDKPGRKDGMVRPMYPVKMWLRWLLVGVLAAAGALAVAPTATAAPSQIVLYVPTEGVSHNSDIGLFAEGDPGDTATVHVNGVDRGTAEIEETMESGIYIIRYDRAWGMGKMHVVVDGLTSNTQPLRALTKVTNLEFRRIGKNATKLRVTVRARTYNPVKNRMMASKKVTLQAKSGKKWTKVRAMKLKKSGKGSVVLKATKARRYRIVIKQTRTTAGAVHEMGGRI